MKMRPYVQDILLRLQADTHPGMSLSTLDPISIRPSVSGINGHSTFHPADAPLQPRHRRVSAVTVLSPPLGLEMGHKDMKLGNALDLFAFHLEGSWERL